MEEPEAAEAAPASVSEALSSLVSLASLARFLSAFLPFGVLLVSASLSAAAAVVEGSLCCSEGSNCCLMSPSPAPPGQKIGTIAYNLHYNRSVKKMFWHLLSLDGHMT